MRFPVVAVCTSLLAVRLAAQAPITLDRPAEVLPEPFSLIRSVRELSDGRLLLTDWTEQRLVLIDSGFTRVTALGRLGAGPQEYRLPSRLLPMPGDSTLLVDVGNERLAVLAPSGRIVRTIAADRTGLESPSGVDREGRIYYAIPPWAPEARNTTPDSNVVVRYDPRRGSVTKVAVVRGITLPHNGGRQLIPGPGHIPFAPQDAWRVTPEGTVVIVRAGGYRVERIGTGGHSIGPSNATATDPVTRADRLAFVREFAAGSPMSGKGPGGAMGQAPPMSDGEVAQMADGNEFAPVFPPFDPSRVSLAPDGELWVGRSDHAGTPARYDRIDSTGRRVAEFRFGAGRRIVGVGNYLYVVATDEDGVQHLERFRRPTAR